jgi:hypothetical protein
MKAIICVASCGPPLRGTQALLAGLKALTCHACCAAPLHATRRLSMLRGTDAAQHAARHPGPLASAKAPVQTLKRGGGVGAGGGQVASEVVCPELSIDHPHVNPLYDGRADCRYGPRAGCGLCV